MSLKMLGRLALKSVPKSKGLLIANSAQVVPKRAWGQIRIISTPPRKKVAAWEVVVHCSLMFAAWMSYPFYFLTQMRYYRASEED